MQRSRRILILILCVLANALYAQRTTVSSPEDPSLTATVEKLGLENLAISNSKDGIHFRLWIGGGITAAVIDIQNSSDSSIRGIITLYTSEVVRYNEKPTDRMYSTTWNLNLPQAHAIYKLFNDKSTLQIPTDSLIKGWSRGLDGETDMIEYADQKSYSLKMYWTPMAQGNLREARIIQAFIDSVSSIADLKRLKVAFIKQIPFESYTASGVSIGGRTETIKQQNAYKRERNRYRRNHHL